MQLGNQNMSLLHGQMCFLIQNQENIAAWDTGSSGESQVSPAPQPLSLNGKDQSRIYVFCTQACSGGESGSSWTFPKFRSQINFPPLLGRAIEGWEKRPLMELLPRLPLYSPRQSKISHAFRRELTHRGDQNLPQKNLVPV